MKLKTPKGTVRPMHLFDRAVSSARRYMAQDQADDALVVITNALNLPNLSSGQAAELYLLRADAQIARHAFNEAANALNSALKRDSGSGVTRRHVQVLVLRSKIEVTKAKMAAPVNRTAPMFRAREYIEQAERIAAASFPDLAKDVSRQKAEFGM